MQYQKDEIKDRILSAALAEFEKTGYRGAVISKIAKQAGVPVGNLYRYFSGKEQLFDAVVADVYENLPDVIRAIYNRDIQFVNQLNEIAKNVAEGIMHIYNRYGRELLLLADRSQGTKYETFIPSLLNLISELFQKGLFREQNDQNRVMSDVIAFGFMNGLFTIMRCGDPGKVEELVKRLLVFYFYQIEKRT